MCNRDACQKFNAAAVAVLSTAIDGNKLTKAHRLQLTQSSRTRKIDNAGNQISAQ
jgi:hypothetical protein